MTVLLVAGRAVGRTNSSKGGMHHHPWRLPALHSLMGNGKKDDGVRRRKEYGR